MTPFRLLLAASLLAAVAAVPASAGPITVAGPGICKGRSITIDETEKLVERTLYFHGTAPVGNVDANNGGSSVLVMNPTAPTSTQDKIYITRATGVIGNPNFNKNSNHGYWVRALDSDERIVCAGASVFAATATGTLVGQLWLDQPSGTTAVRTAQNTASAPANQVSEFQFDFGPMDKTASSEIVFQLDSATPGALTYYDSVGRPSAFKYVVVVKA